MGIFSGWFFFSIIVGFIGIGRRIGFLGAFGLSLLLSPLIGIIITLASKNEADEAYKAKILNAQQSQQEALNKLSQSKQASFSTQSIADELEKLKKLRNENLISEDEFKRLRARLINS